MPISVCDEFNNFENRDKIVTQQKQCVGFVDANLWVGKLTPREERHVNKVLNKIKPNILEYSDTKVEDIAINRRSRKTLKIESDEVVEIVSVSASGDITWNAMVKFNQSTHRSISAI